ncbi:transglycosylase SLT domain-containing protein [Leucobacter sp. W1038]|uniref:aggregation-promoting factor C-terminal-like domain-containing protein n=1 Tax=Leucobacter sp. W1038 TaxID=3438281 RepID=UPI003D9759E2
MTSSTPAARPPISRLTRFRGLFAGIAAVGFFGTAVVAPLSIPTTALADEAFYERIHQEFVPEVTELALDVSVSPLVEIPEPKPEPVVAPAPAPAAAAPVSFAPLLYTGGGSPAEWMAAAGIPQADWGYVDFIVSRESGWNPNATNSSSGACGLVQALPCSKVPGGNGYDPVANLTWANGYAIGRYGSWAGAHAFWTSNHWW